MQRYEFDRLVENTIRQIESAESPHTAAFVFRGIRAGVARISAFPWDSSRSTSARHRVQELKALIGLTSLITSDPPMPPKLN